VFLCVSLQIFYFTKHSGKFYTCLVLQAKTNTWSHQRRKRRQEARKRHSESDNACEQEEANKMSENMGMDAEPESKEMNNESEDKSVKNIVSEEKSNTKCSENEEERDTINTEVDEKVKAINEKGEGEQDKSRKRSHDQSDGCEGGSEVKRAKQEDESQDHSDVKALPKMRSRQEIIEQFHKEQTENDGVGKKKKPLSFYEKLEPFSESEECLLLCKFVLKKEEGKMNLTLTHLGGDKNAMYQIMQYFRNKLAVQT